jgi:hypothetical protein
LEQIIGGLHVVQEVYQQESIYSMLR